MSGRTTAEIEAALRGDVHTNCSFDTPCWIVIRQLDGIYP